MLNRLIKEVKEYTKAPVSDIKLQINEENFTDLRAEISGPGACSIIVCFMPCLLFHATLSAAVLLSACLPLFLLRR